MKEYFPCPWNEYLGMENRGEQESTLETPKRLFVRISGRVQNVGFRFFACEAARELDLNGYVRNTSDGAVEVCAEGDTTSLNEFLRLLGKGPQGARVTHLEVKWDHPTYEYRNFSIIR